MEKKKSKPLVQATHGFVLFYRVKKQTPEVLRNQLSQVTYYRIGAVKENTVFHLTHNPENFGGSDKVIKWNLTLNPHCFANLRPPLHITNTP